MAFIICPNPQILLFGGLDSTGRPLSDLWELDISEYYNSAYALFGSTIDEQTKKIPPNRRYSSVLELFFSFY